MFWEKAKYLSLKNVWKKKAKGFKVQKVIERKSENIRLKKSNGKKNIKYLIPKISFFPGENC